jgi:hypothetical protein
MGVAINLAEFAKQANSPAEAAAASASRRLRRDAVGDIRDVALWSLGLGAAARGATGLVNLMRRNISERASTGAPVEMQPSLPEEEEKIAATGDQYFGSPVTNKESLWFYYPGMLMGGLAAGYGGWKAVDRVLDKRRRQSVDDELETNRSKFRQALSGIASGKTAADHDPQAATLGQDLDRLFDGFEKAAGMFGDQTAGDVMGKGMGMYATYAIPSALLAGYAAYSAGVKRQRRALIEKALQRRERRRQSQQPAPLYVPAGLPRLPAAAPPVANALTAAEEEAVA